MPEGQVAQVPTPASPPKGASARWAIWVFSGDDPQNACHGGDDCRAVERSAASQIQNLPVKVPTFDAHLRLSSFPVGVSRP